MRPAQSYARELASSVESAPRTRADRLDDRDHLRGAGKVFRQLLSHRRLVSASAPRVGSRANMKKCMSHVTAIRWEKTKVASTGGKGRHISGVQIECHEPL